MSNVQKWLIIIVITFGTSTISAMTDERAGARDYIRHGLMGLVPALTALKTKLEGGDD